MVPIHRRKLVVQKAQQGKLFEIPKSPLTKEINSVYKQVKINWVEFFVLNFRFN